MTIYETWRSGKVNRMHTMPQLVRENVAEHTWGVILLILKYWPSASRNLIVRAHLHDAGEIATGDIPGHIKWANPDLTAVVERLENEHISAMGFDLSLFPLTPDEELILDICDRLEFCISCLHELRLGNQNAAQYFNRSAEKARKAIRELSTDEARYPAMNLLRDIQLVILQHKTQGVRDVC